MNSENAQLKEVNERDIKMYVISRGQAFVKQVHKQHDLVKAQQRGEKPDP
jgi:hypothetical protein